MGKGLACGGLEIDLQHGTLVPQSHHITGSGPRVPSTAGVLPRPSKGSNHLVKVFYFPLVFALNLALQSYEVHSFIRYLLINIFLQSRCQFCSSNLYSVKEKSKPTVLEAAQSTFFLSKRKIFNSLSSMSPSLALWGHHIQLRIPGKSGVTWPNRAARLGAEGEVKGTCNLMHTGLIYTRIHFHVYTQHSIAQITCTTRSVPTHWLAPLKFRGCWCRAEIIILTMWQARPSRSPPLMGILTKVFKSKIKKKEKNQKKKKKKCLSQRIKMGIIWANQRICVLQIHNILQSPLPTEFSSIKQTIPFD